MIARITQRIAPTTALRKSASLWFVTIAAGHWIFLSYVIIIFGGTAVQGDLVAWNDRLSQGHVPGDLVGNSAVAAHLLLAVFVLGAGPLQLIPHIRSRYPAFHRWTGRIYTASVAIATLSGLYMLFNRDIGSASLKAGFVLQTFTIILFAGFALRYAIARQIDRHRRWALRFFMVASIALTYRVILMVWMLTTGGAGINFQNGEGAFLDFMAIGQFFPLLMLEIYFRTKEQGSVASRYAMAVFLSVAALATALGVLMLSVGLWFA